MDIRLHREPESGVYALLFLFKHVLKKDFGKVEDVVRAKRANYILVVLSRADVDRVIRFLGSPFDLAA